MSTPIIRLWREERRLRDVSRRLKSDEGNVSAAFVNLKTAVGKTVSRPAGLMACFASGLALGNMRQRSGPGPSAHAGEGRSAMKLGSIATWLLRSAIKLDAV